MTVTLPTVTTTQNGSNSAETSAIAFDSQGRMIWSKDGAGYLTYMAYDDATGAVTKVINDVDTTQTTTFANLPSGWSTPGGGGLHQTTTYEVDTLGRNTKVTDPNGNLTYIVYNDTTNNVPTGPTQVTRHDRARGYTETLTMSATPNVSSGRPTGTESISSVLTLSRTAVNDAGQVVTSDTYFDLTGLSYGTNLILSGATENTP